MKCCSLNFIYYFFEYKFEFFYQCKLVKLVSYGYH